MSHESTPQAQPPSPLLSTRALLILLCGVGAAYAAAQSPSWATGLATLVAVVLALRETVGP